MLRCLVLCAVAAVGVGCSDPYDTAIPPNMSDPAFLEAAKELPEADRVALGDYYARVTGAAVGSQLSSLLGGGDAPTGGIPPGTTIRQAIDAQRAWEEKKRASRLVAGARAGASTIRTGVLLFMVDHHASCPTLADLRKGGYLSEDHPVEDPWKHAYQIECAEAEVPEIYSLGPDGQRGGCDPGYGADDGCEL